MDNGLVLGLVPVSVTDDFVLILVVVDNGLVPDFDPSDSTQFFES